MQAFPVFSTLPDAQRLAVRGRPCRAHWAWDGPDPWHPTATYRPGPTATAVIRAFFIDDCAGAAVHRSSGAASTGRRRGDGGRSGRGRSGNGRYGRGRRCRERCRGRRGAGAAAENDDEEDRTQLMHDLPEGWGSAWVASHSSENTGDLSDAFGAAPFPQSARCPRAPTDALAATRSLGAICSDRPARTRSSVRARRSQAIWRGSRRARLVPWCAMTTRGTRVRQGPRS